jgi:hypothetical protein
VLLIDEMGQQSKEIGFQVQDMSILNVALHQVKAFHQAEVSEEPRVPVLQLWIVPLLAQATHFLSQLIS